MLKIVSCGDAMFVGTTQEEVKKAKEWWYNHHKEQGDRCKDCIFLKDKWCKYHEEYIIDEETEVCEYYL